MHEPAISIARGENDLLFDAEGRSYIDLFCGSGSVFLGHAHPRITRAVQDQLSAVWLTGALASPARDEATTLVEGYFPPSHRLAGFYSTGMEAAEFALRLARIATGRKGVVGFERCMHGKSTATASLGWRNDEVNLPDYERLPYVPACAEDEILERVRDALADRTVGAVIIEPFQGSGGGYLASSGFFSQLGRLCTEQGTLLVVDEIFSGFNRTGEPFVHSTWGFMPDVVLIGKAMGNGFPVSGVVIDRRIAIEPRMLPGSTFAGNPVAASAVAATLREMAAMDVKTRVREISGTILSMVSPVTGAGGTLRGRGAMWVLELGVDVNLQAVAARIIQSGVIVSVVGPYIRLLPSATISQAHLIEACAVVRDACLAHASHHVKQS